MTAKLTSTVLAAGALLAIAPAADAATSFGSRLNHDPANSGECLSLMGPCTIAAFIHPSDPDGDPYSGGAPVDGVITRFRTRATGAGGQAATVTLKLAEVTRPDPNNNDTALARLVATGPTVTIPANNQPEVPVHEFAARLPVKKGQQLALEGTNVWATYNTSGDKFSYVYSPPLTAGQGPRGSTAATGELLVQATIEPDTDGDGYGDETQDGCPQSPSTQAPPCGPAADLVPPTLASLRLRPRRFGVAGRRRASLSAAKGTRISYSLSEAATVRFTVRRAVPGRRVGGRCVKPRRGNVGRRRCVRFVRLRGSLSHKGSAGRNSFRWNGRLRRRALAPGAYRLSARATDAAGNRSATITRSFTVLE